jgi:hypothetical protein
MIMPAVQVEAFLGMGWLVWLVPRQPGRGYESCIVGCVLCGQEGYAHEISGSMKDGIYAHADCYQKATRNTIAVMVISRCKPTTFSRRN